MHSVTPDALRELAHMLETGLDVVGLAERMSSAGDHELPMLRRELEERLKAAHLDPGALIVIGGWMATVGLELRKEQKDAEAALKPHDYEYDTPAPVLEFRR